MHHRLFDFLSVYIPGFDSGLKIVIVNCLGEFVDVAVLFFINEVETYFYILPVFLAGLIHFFDFLVGKLEVSEFDVGDLSLVHNKKIVLHIDVESCLNFFFK